MSDGPDEGQAAEPDKPVVRDKRRIDPATGEVRPEAAASAAASPDDLSALEEQLADVVSSDIELQLAERTEDLQRLHAEFANYRRRVERDRQAVAEQALGSVLLGLLPVLDDIDRARLHGEVEGGFKLVADGLDLTLTKLGLQRFGEAGEPFDPTVHEALTHGLSADVTEPTCAEIYQPGYRVGDRILRPARVAVVDPASDEPASAAPADEHSVDDDQT
jgi:molecular chaperone GrpE